MGSKLSDIISFDGTKISYLVKEGVSPAIIFMHGSGSNHSMWIPYLEHFKNKIIAPDARGHGHSGYGIINVENSAKDVLEIIKKEKIKSAILVGNSFGASVALEIYRKNPKKIKKMVLAVPFSKKLAKGGWIISPILSTVLTMIKPFHFKRKLRFQDYSKCIGKPFWYFPTLDIRGTSFNMYLGSIKSLFEYNIDLKNIKVPTVIVLATKDICKKEKIISQGKKGITFLIINSHHIFAGRDPKKLIQIIKNSI